MQNSYSAADLNFQIKKLRNKYYRDTEAKTSLQSESAMKAHSDGLHSLIHNYPNFSATTREFIEYIRLCSSDYSKDEWANIFLTKTNYALSIQGKIWNVTSEFIKVEDKCVHESKGGNLDIHSYAYITYPSSFRSKALKLEPGQACCFKIQFTPELFFTEAYDSSHPNTYHPNTIRCYQNDSWYDESRTDSSYFGGSLTGEENISLGASRKQKIIVKCTTYGIIGAVAGYLVGLIGGGILIFLGGIIKAIFSLFSNSNSQPIENLNFYIAVFVAIFGAAIGVTFGYWTVKEE